MLTWGLTIFAGLWLLLADVAPVRRAKMMGNPWLIHTIVIGSGLLIPEAVSRASQKRTFTKSSLR